MRCLRRSCALGSADRTKQLAFPEVGAGGSADPLKAEHGRRSLGEKEATRLTALTRDIGPLLWT